MLDSDFKKIIDNARDVLVGKVPDPKAQIEQITTAMIYKFMDYMDLENIDLGLEPQFFVKEYQQYSWSQLLDSKLSGQARLDLYVQAITKLPQSPYLPPLFRNIFKGTFLPFRDFRTLNMFLKEIDKFDYKNSENLGNAFEYLLSILGSQGDAGQFRTPRHIIDFIVSAVNPQKEDTILDPACGTAGFLISAYKHIVKTNSQNYKANGDSTIIAGTSAYDTVLDSTENYMGEMLTPYQKGKLLTNVTGYDISPDMVKLSLVNLYLHGFKQPKIFEYDTLSDDKRWDDDFDVILANPPFMSPKGGITPHKRFSIQANRAELLFVDYIAEHLKIRGRAGIIVPEGIIFQASNAYKNLRKNLIENWGLYAVVSIPSGVFQPYSGVKTSILFLDKNLAKQSPDILFIKITNDGFDLGAQRRRIDKNDLPEALQILKEWKLNKQLLNEEIALKIPKTKIAEDGDYNLTAERYKEAIDYSNVKWDMVELGEVCDFIGGYAFKSNDLLKTKSSSLDYPVIKIGNLINKSVINIDKTQFFNYNSSLIKYVIHIDDLLIAMTGATVGKVCVAQISNLLLNQRVGLLRVKDLIKPKFLKNILFSDSFYNFCQINSGGGAQGNISPKQILSYKIPLPPLEVQQEIVAEIEQYQKVIDGAKQVVESYKPQIEIDPEWEKVKLGDVGKVFGGYAFKSKDMNKKDGVQVIKIGNVQDRCFDTQRNPSFIDISFYKNHLNFIVKENDILISMTGTAGKRDYGNVCIVDKTGKYLLNQRVGKIVPTENIIRVYLYILLNQRFVKDLFFLSATGGVRQGNISNKQIESIIIPLPPLPVQQEIVSRIEEEQKYVDGCKRLIEIYEEKIKIRIEKVWGE